MAWYATAANTSDATDQNTVRLETGVLILDSQDDLTQHKLLWLIPC